VAKNNPEFAEVQYFFLAKVKGVEKGVALISCYSAPDPGLRASSSGALLVCQYKGMVSLEVILVKNIVSCIAMIPFPGHGDRKHFVCEKMGLDVAFLSGSQEPEVDVTNTDL